MAVVTQNLTPDRTYSPFEGMSEARRLQTAVPRGLVRFDTQNGQASTAKPVNDSYDLQITCSLPEGFAYMPTSLQFGLHADTISDFDELVSARIFNGISSVGSSTTQWAVFDMTEVPRTVATSPGRVLNYGRGVLTAFFNQPVTKNSRLSGHSFILNYHNSAAAVGGAGTIDFHLALYQYELNQAVRFPLNFPVPVGIR